MVSEDGKYKSSLNYNTENLYINCDNSQRFIYMKLKRGSTKEDIQNYYKKYITKTVIQKNQKKMYDNEEFRYLS